MGYGVYHEGSWHDVVRAAQNLDSVAWLHQQYGYVWWSNSVCPIILAIFTLQTFVGSVNFIMQVCWNAVSP